MQDNTKLNIAVIGASGAIGISLIKQLSALYAGATIHAFSRNELGPNVKNTINYVIDYANEASIEEAASIASKEAVIDMVIVATGVLHVDGIMPEKALRELSAEKFRYLFEVNTILPALIAKYFLPKLNRDNRAVFAVLSARVGSISDNQLGGWYAYRASKAALNMIIKNAAIEIGRRNKKSIIVGLHPGTVDSNLSKPFQGNVPDGKLFKADFSANNLLKVLENLTPEHSGRCFAWDGQEIEP
ncbi:MAG: SDR family NAD(P)-dependent oxidoreductase [Emcibacteraceae bacterium]|nr:SDR family NAD(P)-dependent oxidoreductase [Emcibacteraceae bacterium]